MNHEKEEVLAWLKRREGLYSRVDTIAKQLDLPIKTVNQYLKELDCVGTRFNGGGRRTYGIPVEEAKPTPRWVKPFTPMTPEVYAKRIDTKGVVSI
jgi:predicted transcriptional regulator